MMHFLKSTFLCTLCCFLFHWSGTAQPTTPYTPSPENLEARQRFAAQRFGIFIHWGLYSLLGQGEWYMQNANIHRDEYEKLANAFYPHDFDADEWVDIFQRSGARYVTFTTRHHDGFSMWNSASNPFNCMHTPYHKDILKKLAKACHKRHFGLHLYYSHLDWRRLDYPQGRTGTGTRPGRDPKGNYDSYFQFMNTQLTELLTQYGKVDAIWFDGLWDQDEHPDFNWRLPEQYALIHRLQPACLIGNNHHKTPYPGEDIQIFERDVPGENTAGLSGQSIGQLPLETCQTMNGMWGYKIVDQNYKSTATLVQLLVRTAAKGANLLLNVGPQPDGKLPQAAIARLDSIGTWLRTYGCTIYDTEAGPIHPGQNVVSTQKGNTIYLHLLGHTPSELSFRWDKKLVRIEDFDTQRPINYHLQQGKLTLHLPAAPDAIDRILKIIVR